MRHISVIAIAAAACLAARPVLAQERDTVPLTPIVVTATRAPAPLNTLANAVSVLEGDDLSRAGIVSVADAIRSLPGVAVVQGGSFGSVTSLFLRGGQSDYVRVLVDGVPVNLTGGYLDLANVSTLNVERVELVRGPSSVLYGSDAVSGVMQIFTRRFAGPHTSLGYRAGTYGSADMDVELSAGTRAAGVSLALAQSSTDGIYDFNNHYRNTTASLGLSLASAAGSSVTAAIRYTDAVLHFPTDGLGTANDSNQFQTGRALTLSIDATHALTPRLLAQLALGYNESRGRTDDEPDNAADTAGLTTYHDRNTVSRRSADLRFSWRASGTSTLTLGGAVESESDRDTNDYQFPPFGGGGGSMDTSRVNRALYAQAVTGWRERVFLQAGFRVDDNDKFGTFGTWRLGASVRVAGATRVRVNAGRAFKEPTFDQTYSSGFTVGNPDLRPERALSWEAGIEQGIGARGSVSVSWFDQRFRDMIQFTSVAPGTPNYHNVAGANASGLEVEASARLAASLRITGQYTWLDTKVTDPGADSLTFAPGRPLLRRPEHSAALILDVAPAGRVAAGARVAYVGRREDLDFTTFLISRVVMPAYGRVDVWASVALLGTGPAHTGLTLTARVDNVFDIAYQEVYRYRSPGRMLRLGMRVDAGR